MLRDFFCIAVNVSRHLCIYNSMPFFGISRAFPVWPIYRQRLVHLLAVHARCTFGAACCCIFLALSDICPDVYFTTIFCDFFCPLFPVMLTT